MWGEDTLQLSLFLYAMISCCCCCSSPCGRAALSLSTPSLPPVLACMCALRPALSAFLRLHPWILTAAPAPSCHQKPLVPPLQSGSPSAAWGSKDTRTATGYWTRTPRNSWHEGVKQEWCPTCMQT